MKLHSFFSRNKRRILPCAILFLILLYVIGGLGITALTFKNTYRAYNIPEDTAIAHWDYYENTYHRREVSFDSRGNLLKGHVYEVDAPKGLIVFSHGIWSGEEEYLTLITWLMDQNWDVFSYSYTAYNGSEGASAKGLPQSPIDLDSALTYVESDSQINHLTRVLMGHSWGAYASTAGLIYGHHVDGVVALSGFSDPIEISSDVADRMFGILGRSLNWAVDLLNKQRFGSESRQTAIAGINSISAPVLLVHGINDSFIGYNTSSIISHKDEITNPNVTYITLDDPLQSDHNNYFGNADATAYFKELDEQYKELSKQYKGGNVPDDVKKDFYAHTDKNRANQPNAALFEQIEAFLETEVLH